MLTLSASACRLLMRSFVWHHEIVSWLIKVNRTVFVPPILMHVCSMIRRILPCYLIVPSYMPTPRKSLSKYSPTPSVVFQLNSILTSSSPSVYLEFESSFWLTMQE